MLCPICSAPARRFGRDRRGHQRFQCPACRRTFSDPNRPERDRRRLPADRAVFCLRLLLEGNSVRSTERLTGTHRDTILALLVEAGRDCQRLLETRLRRLTVADVEADEMWGFIGCKEKTRIRRGYGETFGDAYCYVAIERTNKLVVCWHLGKRCPEDTQVFIEKLWRATQEPYQLTTDGYTPYRVAVPNVFGRRLDFAQLVKVYGQPADDDHRYSPAEVVDIHAVVRTGRPDEDRICTSHVERSNLTMRMMIRRLTRLTNGFSKKWENHEAALGLFFAYYNYCRVHQTLRTTPAVAAGLETETWTVADLLEQAAAA
jgi:transposase-like protein/IS1 family transposase